MRRILVIGSTNIDYVIHVDHFAVAGETIKGADFEANFGGKGANQAFACGKLGGSTSFISAVGSDEMGRKAVNNLRSTNVQVEQVRIVNQVPTGLAFICVSKESDNSIVVVPGANDRCDSEWIAKQQNVLADSDILMLQLETPPEGIWYAAREGKRLEKLVILDPAPVPTSGIPNDIYECVTYLTPNETELHALTGMPVDTEAEIHCAANELMRRGAQNVIVTMGNRGALLVSSGKSMRFEAYQVTPIDSTAAGDTFNAALAVQLSHPGTDIVRAIQYANAAAALATTRRGAQKSMPSLEEVEAFLAQARATDKEIGS